MRTSQLHVTAEEVTADAPIRQRDPWVAGFLSFLLAFVSRKATPRRSLVRHNRIIRSGLCPCGSIASSSCVHQYRERSSYRSLVMWLRFFSVVRLAKDIRRPYKPNKWYVSVFCGGRHCFVHLFRCHKRIYYQVEQRTCRIDDSNFGYR